MSVAIATLHSAPGGVNSSLWERLQIECPNSLSSHISKETTPNLLYIEDRVMSYINGAKRSLPTPENPKGVKRSKPNFTWCNTTSVGVANTSNGERKQTSQKTTNNGESSSCTKSNVVENKGLIPKYLKCYVCDRIVKEDSFTGHLLFGALKCTGCAMYFSNCLSFQLHSWQKTMSNSDCNHKFEYRVDPVTYLKDNLFSINKKTFKEKMIVYIEKLDSLEDKQPWSQAILQCKLFLKLKSQVKKKNDAQKAEEKQIIKTNRSDNVGVKNSRENSFEDILTQQYDMEELAKDTEFVQVRESITTPEHTKSMEQHSSKSQHEVKVPEHTKSMKQLSSELEPIQAKSRKQHNSESKIKVKLSKNAKSKQLSLKSKHNVTVNRFLSFSDLTNSKKQYSSKSKSEMKVPKSLNTPEHIKSKKRISTENESDSSAKKEEEAIEFLPVPSNGFYYVSLKAIEMCPNCYEILCPSQFTVNIDTFLMTVICRGCKLTIYITAGSSEVKIVTEND